MGRKRDTDIVGGLEKRLEGSSTSAKVSAAPEPAPAPQAAPAPSRKAGARDGMKFVGFYTTEEQTEKLRVLAFETRQEKQVLMREALDLLFKRYGQ
ncbi:ribbon-helix-helix domain-containing protein [Methylorubrum extorquens]|uniref:ribbon-helix-helix domain-containing protein n=1 Tax=Methylorubrum extorquens TaxID=408 RepID=UPI0012DB1438|nr:ribbon-helix-helix domain-containing protein [Methylorubrum extorquens]